MLSSSIILTYLDIKPSKFPRAIWRFPKMRVPPNHPAIGVSPFLEIPIWATVNTHYMVDGHPIHNKDPKIMVIVNPIKSPLDD